MERAGGVALSLLSVPLNVEVLQALNGEPKALLDLRRAVGSPPQTTLRGYLRVLAETGILERQREEVFPGSVGYSLGRAGVDMLAVADLLQDWLEAAPEGSLQLGTQAAKSAVKALVDGWSSAIVWALAARPLALTELSRLINDLSYPSLERRLAALRLSGQIESCPGSGRGTPYAVADWLRMAVKMIAAASLWERRHLPDSSAPLKRIDAEAAFLLAIPLVQLPEEVTGSCRLAVQLTNGHDSRFAGVTVSFQDGELLSCVPKLEGGAEAWISGSSTAWLHALLGRDAPLEIGGASAVARDLLVALQAHPANRLEKLSSVAIP